MPVKHCCYGNCNSDSRYVGKRPEMNGIFFIPFPKPKTQGEKCARWIRLCGRKFFDIQNITKDTYMCSKHFVGGNGPTLDHPDPLPAAATEVEIRMLSNKRKRKSPSEKTTNLVPKGRKTLLENESVQHQDHSYSCSSGLCKSSKDESDQSNEDIFPPTSSNGCPDIWMDAVEEIVVDTCKTDTAEFCNSESQTDVSRGISVEIQTDITMGHLVDYSTEDLKAGAGLRRKMFMKYVLKDDSSCKFYTGLSLVMLSFLFTWLEPKAAKLNYWRGQDTTESKPERKVGSKRKLSMKEEFILTLARLRRGFDVEVLGDLFGVHPSVISRIFTTWTNFLFQELYFLISWPSREQITKNLPKAFKYFPKTRSIIDCTEFFIQKPSLPSSQRVTWSQYKHRNTFKALISISPTGTFTFISKLYTGSISDRRIVEESGFLDKLEYGDDVMADRGFLVRDLLAKHYATLNIPPFSMGKQMSSHAVTKTRRIASARIHVERAIGRLKTFKILQGVIPLKLHALCDQIIVVCCALCNLDKQLVK